MRDRDIKFFNVAKEVAKMSTWSDKVRDQVGAIVVLRNEIIATGYNRNKGNTFHSKFAELAGYSNPGREKAIYAHAETSALAKVYQSRMYSETDFQLMKLFVYREVEAGIAMARPCDVCTLAIKHLKIKNVFYSTPDGFAHESFI